MATGLHRSADHAAETGGLRKLVRPAVHPAAERVVQPLRVRLSAVHSYFSLIGNRACRFFHPLDVGVGLLKLVRPTRWWPFCPLKGISETSGIQ